MRRLALDELQDVQTAAPFDRLAEGAGLQLPRRSRELRGEVALLHPAEIDDVGGLPGRGIRLGDRLERLAALGLQLDLPRDLLSLRGVGDRVGEDDHLPQVHHLVDLELALVLVVVAPQLLFVDLDPRLHLAPHHLLNHQVALHPLAQARLVEPRGGERGAELLVGVELHSLARLRHRVVDLPLRDVDAELIGSRQQQELLVEIAIGLASGAVEQLLAPVRRQLGGGADGVDAFLQAPSGSPRGWRSGC